MVVHMAQSKSCDFGLELVCIIDRIQTIDQFFPDQCSLERSGAIFHFLFEFQWKMPLTWMVFEVCPTWDTGSQPPICPVSSKFSARSYCSGGLRQLLRANMALQTVTLPLPATGSKNRWYLRFFLCNSEPGSGIMLQGLLLKPHTLDPLLILQGHLSFRNTSKIFGC